MADHPAFEPVARLVPRAKACLRVVLLLASIPLAMGQSCLLPSAGQAEEGCRTPANADDLERAALTLVNEERTSRGLSEVVLSPVLTTMAEDYCCEMIQYDFFAHVNPYHGPQDPQDALLQRALDAGYFALAVGENLAEGQTTAEQVVADWLASPDHRENLLHPSWCEMGIAVRRAGASGPFYWTQEFGQPSSCAD